MTHVNEFDNNRINLGLCLDKDNFMKEKLKVLFYGRCHKRSVGILREYLRIFSKRIFGTTHRISMNLLIKHLWIFSEKGYGSSLIEDPPFYGTSIDLLALLLFSSFH